MMKLDELYNSLGGPFVIEKDNDYYTEAQKKLLDFIKLLEQCKADSGLIKQAGAFRDTLMRILREYLKGNIATAQLKMVNQVKKICREDQNAVGNVNGCNIFDGDSFDIPFFRARLDADEDGFQTKDMGVIPFCTRTKTKTERFSMPGLPCLYLGNTSYVCWLEMGKPADYRFNVAPVLLDGTQRIFDLTVSLGCIMGRNELWELELRSDISLGMIKRVMLSICSSYRVKECERSFKSEYIIPQLLMLACQKCGLDGVAYISSKIQNTDMYGVCAVNVALYSKYPNNTFNAKGEVSELEKHVEIGNPTNFAIYKNIKQLVSMNRREILWIDRCKWIRKVDAGGNQVPYQQTEFYDFDYYLVEKWERMVKKEFN